MAVAIIASGSYLAGTVWPPVVQHFIQGGGWRRTYRGNRCLLRGWMSGVIFDLTGSYQTAFLNGILWNLLNLGIAVGLLRHPGRSLEQA